MKQNYLIIPINIYEGIIEIKGESKLHPLHSLILECVVVEHNLERVINAFGLDRRIVQEALVDLMYREMVYVDLENSLIFVSPEIEDAIDSGRLETYLGNEFPENIAVKWVQDTVTGQIMMFEEVRVFFRKPLNLSEEYISSRDRLQLKRREFIKIQDLNPKSLIKIAKMVIRNNVFEGDVLDRVNRIKRLDFVDSRSIFIPLEKRIFHGSSYEVPVANSIPPNVLEYWTKVITEIDAYSISDLTPVEEDFLAQYDRKTLLRKWNPIIGKISNLFQKGISKGKIRQLAREISRSLEYEGLKYIIPQMSELGASVETLRVNIASGVKILSELEKLISEVEDLIIIGSAFISEKGFNQVIPLLEKCINNNKRVILLWGLLGEPIEDLKQKFPIFSNENICFIRSEDPFHSKFVIIDTTYVWITSCNLLSYWYDQTSPEETICELKGGKVVKELFEYVRLKFIKKEKPINWIDNISQKHQEKSKEIIKQESKLEEIRIIVEEINEKTQALIEKPSDSNLIESIRSNFKQFNRILRFLRNIETAVLIKDLEHRKILRVGLQYSRKTVRIGTDRILPSALGSVIISALNNSLDRGIPVQVRWGRENRRIIDEKTLVDHQKTISNLLNETKNRIEIPNFPSQSHAKFMTLDNHLSVITSYNLFAFAGNGLADDEITEELGVVLSSPNATKIINDSFPIPVEIKKAYDRKKKRKSKGKTNSKR